MENPVTYADILKQVVTTAGTVAAVSGAITYGFMQALTNAKLVTGRWKGITTAIIGFWMAIFFGKLLLGSWFSIFNIAVALVVAFATPGAYSVAKNLYTGGKQDPQA